MSFKFDLDDESSLDSSDSEYCDDSDTRDESDEGGGEADLGHDDATQRQQRVFNFDDLDEDFRPPPKFRPKRVPGVQLEEVKTRGGDRQFLRPVDFFKLFFTADLVSSICEFTNLNARENAERKSSLYKGWYDLHIDEFYRFCALLMYTGIVVAPSVDRFWSKKSLYNGLWARHFMTRKRFMAIMCFLKVSDPRAEDPCDKLRKVKTLYTYINNKCKELFQPYENVSVDERMIRYKGAYSFREYIKERPAKGGLKLWILADAVTGYTYDFDIGLGKRAETGQHGAAYEAVMNLGKSIAGQGYKMYLDTFYTRAELLKDLLKLDIGACGAVSQNRKGFPPLLANVKEFDKASKRGDMRWVRQENVLTMQWKDSRVISLMSTIHSANEQTLTGRRVKVNKRFQELRIRQPNLVKDYNQFMGGVEKSDQLINRYNKYNVLRKTHKYWKTAFYHILDVARLNAYILFQEWREKNPDIPELTKPSRYGQLSFTEELIRELANLDVYQDVPVASNPPVFFSHPIDPEITTNKRNCKLCYKTKKVEKKGFVRCKTCDTYLCFNSSRNCMVDFHRR